MTSLPDFVGSLGVNMIRKHSVLGKNEGKLGRAWLDLPVSHVLLQLVHLIYVGLDSCLGFVDPPFKEVNADGSEDKEGIGLLDEKEVAVSLNGALTVGDHSLETSFDKRLHHLTLVDSFGFCRHQHVKGTQS
jgi:hypothetical protein